MSDIIYTSQQETNRQERFQKFLLRAKDCHKEKFSYTDEYINARTPITIICKVHGPFHQTPDDHVTSLYCCPVCSQDQRSKTKISKKANTFVLRARRVHGSKYEYDKTEYVGNHKQVSIGCRIHGSFQQQASDHLQGKGCPKCKRVGSYSFEYFFYNQPRRNQQGLLYLVKIDDGQHCFLKIGITRRTLKERFRSFKNVTVTPILIVGGTIWDLFTKEQAIKDEMIQYQITPTSIPDGRTECFRSEALLDLCEAIDG